MSKKKADSGWRIADSQSAAISRSRRLCSDFSRTRMKLWAAIPAIRYPLSAIRF
jgi:hypothetical protein